MTVLSLPRGRERDRRLSTVPLMSSSFTASPLGPPTVIEMARILSYSGIKVMSSSKRGEDTSERVIMLALPERGSCLRSRSINASPFGLDEYSTIFPPLNLIERLVIISPHRTIGFEILSHPVRDVGSMSL